MPTGFQSGTDTQTGYNRMRARVTEELQQQLRPEFLNRVDDIIVFPQLTQDEIIQIVNLMIGQLEKRLADKDIGIELTTAARVLLATRGYDPAMGAGPLRRTIQREIENQLSEKILHGEIHEGAIVVVDVNGEGDDAKFMRRPMDPVLNPYSPGAGRKPAALVGRDRPRHDWNVALDRVEIGRSAQPFVLYGLRGVGKTVLHSDFRREAEKEDWLVAQFEAGSDKSLREALGEAMHASLADLARPSAGHRLMKAVKTALSFKASYDQARAWNFGIDLSGTPGGGADTGVLETDLRKLVHDLAAAAEEENVGLAILIDEAQTWNRLTV